MDGSIIFIDSLPASVLPPFMPRQGYEGYSYSTLSHVQARVLVLSRTEAYSLAVNVARLAP